MLDEITISKAITESFTKDFREAMQVDVAIGGAGPAGMTAAYYLAKEGIKTVIFEKQLRVGGGMPGGGMMFNRIVVQDEGKRLLGILTLSDIKAVRQQNWAETRIKEVMTPFDRLKVAILTRML